MMGMMGGMMGAGMMGMMGAKKEVIEPEVIEYLEKTTADELRRMIELLKEKLRLAKINRNYIQMEKDTIHDFYLNNKQEHTEINSKIKNYETDMEKCEESHRVELKVYMQKVKHLEFEHDTNCNQVYLDSSQYMNDEKNAHVDREKSMADSKKENKNNLKVNDYVHIDEIEKYERKNRREIDGMANKLEADKNNLIDTYEGKLKDLRKDLELRLKVEIHEIEERKNQHINELMTSHEKAFRKMKEYYNEITKQNLEHIQAHKMELEHIKAQITENTERIKIIQEESKRFKEPLDQARATERTLKKQLETYPKDKMALKNAKARLKVLKAKYSQMIEDQEELDKKYKLVDKERGDLCKKFENACVYLKKRSEYKNRILENKLDQLREEFEKKEVHLQQIIEKAGFDQRFVEEISKKMEEAIEAKNSILRNLKYSLAHAQKAYNDAIRVYEAKLIEFGIPAEELGLELLETNTSVMPAGLVAAQLL